jgi:hypothetical protein
VLGAALLVGIPVVFVTGLLSYVAYVPALGHNNLIGDPGFLDFYVFSWPASPSWLYALTQGLHVTIGIALVPIVLVKLWSAMPKLFVWPPLGSVALALERASLALLVSSTLFEFAARGDGGADANARMAGRADRAGAGAPARGALAVVSSRLYQGRWRDVRVVSAR